MTSPAPEDALYEFGPFRLDAVRRLLLREGKHVPLSPKAFETLLALVERRGQLVKKEELFKLVWPDSYVEEGNLTQNVFVLRKALGEGPHEHRYIVTVPSQGYRFVAPVVEHNGTASALPATANAGGATRQTIATVAVLPFRAFGAGDDEGHAYLGPGLADALITRLSSASAINVRSTAAVLKYGTGERDALAAGRELGVDSVLDGTVQRAGERLRATVQLVRVADGHTLWADKFDEKFTDVFAVQDSISEQVAEALTVRLTAREQQLLTKRYTENAEAFQEFIRGRYFWNKRTAGGLRKAIECAQQAINIDPAYALAYVGLADSYNLLPGHGGLAPNECFPKAKAAATRALELDDTLAEAYASLAFVNYRYEWDWAASEANFKRAIELKPNYATAHHWYGESLVAGGRFAESVAELRRAQELDPLSLPINADLGQSLYFAGQHEEAAAQLARTLEMDEDFARALVIAGAVRERTGEYEGAIHVLRRAAALSGRNPLALSGLGHAYAVAGRAAEARAVLAELKQVSADRYTAPYNVAVVHAGLGETEETFAQLERAVEQRDVWLVWMKVNPRFARLREDSRFVEVMRRVGLVA